MKIVRLIGLFVVILLTLHFVTSGIIGLESKGQAQNLSIENTISSGPAQNILRHGSAQEIISPGSTQNILKQGEQLIEDKPIYSTTTIISLILAVIGIVVFRRNI